MYNDFLDSTNLTKTITNIIRNYKYEPYDDKQNSFVMAINSPWGTGKTFLLNQLKEYLSSSRDMDIFYYDAWKNDFWSNPLTPIVATITDGYNEVTGSNVKAVGVDGLSRMLEVFSNIAKKIVGALSVSVNYTISPDVSVTAGMNGSELAARSTDNWSDDIERYSNYCKNIDEMKKQLTEIIKENRKVKKNYKLVILVDELDRCKPTFAIQTLEIIKHLFNVKNLYFVFALDIQQLSSAIKVVYGQNTDTMGYLIRFFNQIFQIPQIQPGEFIDGFVQERKIGKTDKNMKYIVEITSKLQREWHLSLRDIQISLNSFDLFFQMSCDAEKIEKDAAPLFFEIYLLLFVLKYKDPQKYENALIDGHNSFPPQLNKNLSSKCETMFIDSPEIYSLIIPNNSTLTISEALRKRMEIYATDSEKEV